MKRKKFVLITLLLPGILLGFLFYPACGIGFAVSKYCSGKRDGQCGRVRSVIISWRGFRLHLHHWMLSTVAGIAGAVAGFSLFSPALFYGFIGGLVFQGIYCYGDWHRIISRKKHDPGLDEALLLACDQKESVVV